ncbi:MAG: permease prefix domain 1-containing protein [Faecalicatena sp.]|uniref:permease prefix domain 1-containing protein n=1 Tax=Faecalicatena sp. TaxID=2005360 RepID=UPI00258E09EE|nr:permease prefix domain 1-containing protein [Faecalicatena sp.]MCI6465845.1 permease prefix domain 1-containing protein [Faecalicatena sp.]MDY5618739.1 permease prefix domain 1-containing protein [Lachnospiraceae bacterium]
MEDKLRAYMDHLFRDVKPDRRSIELKEEILQNLVDKYHDLLAEGKTQEAAYNIAVASIGDMDELLAGLKQELPASRVYDDERMQVWRRKSALRISVAVALYIMCLLPPILLSDTRFENNLAPALMFTLIGIATGLLIYNYMTKPYYQRMDDSIVEEFKEWQQQTDANKRAFRAISSALWALIVVIYILVSFWTFAWHITWVIFLIGVAIEGIIKAVFELKR